MPNTVQDFYLLGTVLWSFMHRRELESPARLVLQVLNPAGGVQSIIRVAFCQRKRPAGQFFFCCWQACAAKFWAHELSYFLQL